MHKCKFKTLTEWRDGKLERIKHKEKRKAVNDWLTNATLYPHLSSSDDAFFESHTEFVNNTLDQVGSQYYKEKDDDEDEDDRKKKKRKKKKMELPF